MHERQHWTWDRSNRSNDPEAPFYQPASVKGQEANRIVYKDNED